MQVLVSCIYKTDDPCDKNATGPLAVLAGDYRETQASYYAAKVKTGQCSLITLLIVLTGTKTGRDAED